MERGMESGESSGVLVKIRSSSGCMIMKKNSEASDRIGPLKCKKKSSRIVTSDSETSDEVLTPQPGTIDPETILVCNVLTGLREGSSVKSGFSRKRNRAELIGLDEDRFVRASSFKEPSKKKKSRLNVIDLDEYDGFDGRFMMKKHTESNGRSALGFMSVSGFNRDNSVERKKKSYVTDPSKANRQEENERDSDSEKPIRVQGKNGVLKVMVSKKKKMDGSFRNFDHSKDKQIKNGSKFQHTSNKNIPVRSLNPLNSEGLEVPWSSLKTDKSRKNSDKILTNKRRRIRDSDSGSEDSETLMKVEMLKTAKRVNSKRGKSQPEPLIPVVKRGSRTEKQRLREKLREMLLAAGWTVDYRPRKSREYMDAVYVNPAGTAYWSIIKAYEAFLKQQNEEPGPSKADTAFASISVEILNKLSRKTRNKIEKDASKRPKGVNGTDGECGQDLFPKESLDNKSEEGSEDSDLHEELLSSFVKQGGKLSKKMYQESDSGFNSKSTSSLYHRDERASCGSNTHKLQGRKSNEYGRCNLLVRSSNEAQNSEIDGFVPYSGKRTILSWLIDNGTVQLSQKVKYMNGRDVMLEGRITREGIHCGCCSKILTIAKFELHAGSKLLQPFQNIYLDSGVSLLQCQIDAWNIQKDATYIAFHNVDTDGYDPHGDICSLCGDGGNLICCDGCPSTFHRSCLDIKTLPTGDWRCPNCTCRNCGAALGDTTTSAEGETVPSLLFCRMCRGKYHKSCTRESSPVQADSIGSGASFCGPTCLKLFEHLHKYLGAKNELEAGFSWSLIQREHEDSDLSTQGLVQRVETNSKLAVALNIMDECYLPIPDRRSGINLIRNIVYNCGSDFNRLNYSGFYTAILERGDEIISAASIRFHGTKLVEMPFFGTRYVYRRQGMCRRLFKAIESAMKTLKIEKIVIPAIPASMNACIHNFGFSPLQDPLKKEIRSLNMLVFPGIDMLQKRLQEDARAPMASGSDAENQKVPSECSPNPEACDMPDIKMDERPGTDSPVLDEKTLGDVSEPRGELLKPSEYLSKRSSDLTAMKCQNVSSVSPADNELQLTRSYQDFNVRDADNADFDVADVLDDRVSGAGTELLDEKLVFVKKSASDELELHRESESKEKPACNEEPFCNENLAVGKKPVPDEKPAETDKPSCNSKADFRPCSTGAKPDLQ